MLSTHSRIRAALLLLVALSGQRALLLPAGCALLAPAPAPASNELVNGARCTIRVWDPSNPQDATKRMDYWGTVASAGSDKIELIEADSEPVAGKPLLEDPEKLPPAVWVRRLRQRGQNRYTIRRDQILLIKVLNPDRVKQVLVSYPVGSRVNIRTCSTDNPHDAAGYRDLWGKLGRPAPAGLTLTEASEETAAIAPRRPRFAC